MHRLFYGLALCLLAGPALAQTGGRSIWWRGVNWWSCAERAPSAAPSANAPGGATSPPNTPPHTLKHSGSPTLSRVAYARAEYQLLGATAPGQSGRHSRRRKRLRHPTPICPRRLRAAAHSPARANSSAQSTRTGKNPISESYCRLREALGQPNPYEQGGMVAHLPAHRE
jgi:hypothetical protein